MFVGCACLPHVNIDNSPPPLRVIAECFEPQLPVANGGNASKYISVRIGDLNVAGPQWVPYMDLYMYLDILVYLDRGEGLAAPRILIGFRVKNINIGLYTHFSVVHFVDLSVP